MNTLVISLMERISEIGTMRAIGAKKSFVRQLITTETMLITLFFGIIGTFLGFVVVKVLQNIGITAPNYFFVILFGGEKLYPIISLSSLLISLGALISVGIISSIYPVQLANKISPIRAIQKGGI